MARRLFPATTAATAAQAAAPAPEPEPAAAPAPAPKPAAPKPAAVAAPPKAATPKPPAPAAAKPPTSLPPEYQSVVDRNIFDSSATRPARSVVATASPASPMPASAEPAYDPDAWAPYAPYLRAVRDISALREAGKIGYAPAPGFSERYPSMDQPAGERYDEGMDWGERTTRAAGQFAPPVMPARDIGAVSAGRLASEARAVDLAYSAAWREAEDLGEKRRLAVEDPRVSTNDLKRMDAEKVAALRRVADLAAARREYGIPTADGNAPGDQLLSPAPVVGPRTGGGKEYY